MTLTGHNQAWPTVADGSEQGAELRVLGLTGQEERTYRELLRCRSATTEQLRASLGLSAEEADRIFGSLQSKGFASWSTGAPPRLLASPPGPAVDVLALEIERELQRARVAAARLAAGWSASPHDRQVDEIVEIINGREAMSRRFESMLKSAREEILGFVARPLVVSERANADLNLEALHRGLRSRSIYERAVFEAPGVAGLVAECETAGEEARIVDRLPGKMLVVDRATALLPVNLEMPGVEPGAAVVHAPLTDSLTALFEELWRRAVPVALAGRPAGADSGGPADDDIRLLSLLVAGLSDDTAGRQLGMSRRTVHRRLGRLMHAVGVDTRLQLVWRATTNGWLPPPT